MEKNDQLYRIENLLDSADAQKHMTDKLHNTPNDDTTDLKENFTQQLTMIFAPVNYLKRIFFM